MSETQGNEQIGQRDERDQQPEEPLLGKEAPVGSGGTPNPGAPDSEEDDYAPYQEQDYDRQPDQQGEQPSPVQEEIREKDADERAEIDPLEDAGA